ncbi:hypothetical protein LT679_10580 [Mucilaginibacter roseus]|uniref:Alginate lyase 2 domain-containing protein n=1 Tax=Mucilaginibacter roseus TaxID=1528868 RepID=A0ABS8U4S3_9SPHI|nr:hypothetical protein [Mucilaginibacter roseus]MCD8741048.1 hypothetical protein [Mucilaginibacter roseus]
MKKHILIAGLLTFLSSLYVLKATAQNVIFSEDFSGYQTGASPGSIKTNAAAIIAHPTGQEGKWLMVKDKATYKLNKNVPLPAKFTLEFDVLAVAEQIKDIAPVCFGFAKDNAAREHISNGGAFVQLHYRDADAINIGNYEFENKEANTTFDLSATANRPLHVKLVVNGQQMAVYLDGDKLADTVLFPAKAAKYFYFSGPWEFDSGAKLYISNIKLSAGT